MAPPTPPAPGPPKLVNMYFKRTVASSKTCEMCGKETTTCLANEGVTDFLYVCPGHLLDPGFARAAPTASNPGSPVTSAPGSPSASPAPGAVPQAEIEKVKKEYEEKLKKKKESDSNDKDKDSSSSSWLKAGLTTGYSAVSSLASTTTTTLFPPPPPVVPSISEVARTAAATATVFALNRDIFRMRQDAARRKWQAKEAKERLSGLSLPAVPRGKVGGSIPGGL